MIVDGYNVIYAWRLDSILMPSQIIDVFTEYASYSRCILLDAKQDNRYNGNTIGLKSRRT